MVASVVELPYLLATLFAQIFQVAVDVCVLIGSIDVGVALQRERAFLAEEVLPRIIDVDATCLLFGRLIVAVACDESFVECVAGLGGKSSTERMIFKLVWLIAIRGTLVLISVSDFPIFSLHVHTDSVQRVGVGEETCLHLWGYLMFVTIVFRYGKRAFLVGEEGLGRLTCCVPTVAMSHICTNVKAIVVEFVSTLSLPVVLIIVRPVLALAVAVDISVH